MKKAPVSKNLPPKKTYAQGGMVAPTKNMVDKMATKNRRQPFAMRGK